MNLTKEQLGALIAPLNPDRISHRSQGGRQLSYLEAWDVKAALIRIFGFGGFSADVIDTQVLHTERDVPKSGQAGQRGETTAFRVTAMSTVRLTIHGRPSAEVTTDGEVLFDVPSQDVTYTETAAASQAGADIGEVTDFAIKTAESDALKRAAIYLGTQFGLSLYNNGSTLDIVKVVLEPKQRAALKELVEERAERAREVQAVVDAATSTTAPQETAGE